MYRNKHIIRKAFEGYFYNTYERLQDYKAYTIYKYDITLSGGAFNFKRGKVDGYDDSAEFPMEMSGKLFTIIAELYANMICDTIKYNKQHNIDKTYDIVFYIHTTEKSKKTYGQYNYIDTKISVMQINSWKFDNVYKSDKNFLINSIAKKIKDNPYIQQYLNNTYNYYNCNVASGVCYKLGEKSTGAYIIELNIMTKDSIATLIDDEIKDNAIKTYNAALNDLINGNIDKDIIDKNESALMQRVDQFDEKYFSDMYREFNKTIWFLYNPTEDNNYDITRTRPTTIKELRPDLFEFLKTYDKQISYNIRCKKHKEVLNKIYNEQTLTADNTISWNCLYTLLKKVLAGIPRKNTPVNDFSEVVYYYIDICEQYLAELSKIATEVYSPKLDELVAEAIANNKRKLKITDLYSAMKSKIQYYLGQLLCLKLIDYPELYKVLDDKKLPFLHNANLPYNYYITAWGRADDGFAFPIIPIINTHIKFNSDCFDYHTRTITLKKYNGFKIHYELSIDALDNIEVYNNIVKRKNLYYSDGTKSTLDHMHYRISDSEFKKLQNDEFDISTRIFNEIVDSLYANFSLKIYEGNEDSTQTSIGSCLYIDFDKSKIDKLINNIKNNDILKTRLEYATKIQKDIDKHVEYMQQFHD